MNANVRVLACGDVDFAVAQTAREGWDTTPAWIRVALAHGPSGCFVAEIDSQRVGMVTTTRHGATGWIGNLIVPPEHRSRGIGRKLMAHAIAHLHAGNVRTIRLEADPPGIPLYRSLGFVDEFESLRFWIDSSDHVRDGGASRLTAPDVPAVTRFDAEQFGADRGRLLERLFEQADSVFVLRAGEAVRGYALARSSRTGMRVGPCVAADREAADWLLGSVLADCHGYAVALGTPCVNGQAIELIAAYGFSPAPSSHRMIHGERAGDGCPGAIYAIADGAMG